MRVADYIMAFIYDRLKVDTLFMVSGGGIMHLTDAIACHGKMRYVCSHNEQATTMEADGYAKASGGFGVALVTTGPGATNAITGVVGAWQDSTPLFVISGQSKFSQTIESTGKKLRQFGVQEAHILPMIESVTKYSVMLKDPQQVRYQLEKAMFLANSGRPGPVWIDVPLDIQGTPINPDSLPGYDPKLEENADGSTATTGLDATITDVLTSLATAQRPVIMAGHGVRIAKAVDQFRHLIETLNIPVVTPRMGIDLLETGHPLYVGRPGIKGDRAANFAVQNSDLVIAIGTRLSINVTGHEYGKFAREARVLVVDVDAVEHQKPTIRIDSFIRCDAREFINRLVEAAQRQGFRSGDEWPARCRSWKARYPVVLAEYRQQESPVNTYFFTGVLSEKLAEGDIIVIDSGSSSYVVSQSISIKRGQRYLASGGLGAMGYALPASLGASVARGGRVICITGDGSLHMNLQELQTVAHEKLPLKIFVYNNHGYASIKATQHNYFSDRFVGVDHMSGVALPDLLKIAELYGIKGIRIENTQQIAPLIDEALACPGPVLVDVVCSPDQPIIPTVYSKKRDDGSMVSQPLEDMYPFLDREEFLREMIVRPLPE